MPDQRDTAMTQDTIFANAKLILRKEVLHGALVVRDGKIADIDPGGSVARGAMDCGGQFLSPGLIELHTDNLERHMQPRPHVDWPHKPAILAHDRELASAGITTVFDAIRVGSIVSDNSKKRYGRYARAMADEVLAMRRAGVLRISHHIHLRAEICSETLAEELDEFGPDDKIGIVSLMDHTPGQRQFRDLQKFEDYVCGKNGLSREGFGDYVTFLYGLRDKMGEGHEAATVAAAARYGARLASHDDTTADQVAHSQQLGVTLGEFPTTLEAAEQCHIAGIATIMGAPNLVRGGSHSGNVAAIDLARHHRLDILSSDYVPASLLQGAVELGGLWQDMAAGLATVTHTAAHHVGLTDRGALEIGKRADLTVFGLLDGTPVIDSVWAEGRRVG